MFSKIVFFIVFPVILSATKFCADEKCDRRDHRIANGVISERNSRPFQVALYSRVGTDGEPGFCGGALVHPRWVLSAAHCCFHGEQLVDNVQAILGAHSLYDRFENGRRVVNVESITVHPEWDPDTFANDLALLQLANTMQITDMVDVVRLPYGNLVISNFAGQGATASGWGIAAEGVTFVSPTLRQYFMAVMTDPMCNTAYGNRLPPNTICGLPTSSGTCKGDNGGPMTVFINATEETILVGITSFIDISGCNTDRPSVFTRVQRYLPWINEVTGIPLE
ncbi:hypothetical protein ABMA27_003954 [Loxostege sticticalis]|uniref:Peptidase S1 domain-containing protein n=1 Tax=Loxostege sticticalis TaxID=481309 RepID=A0ABR3HQX3_LOXSC